MAIETRRASTRAVAFLAVVTIAAVSCGDKAAAPITEPSTTRPPETTTATSTTVPETTTSVVTTTTTATAPTTTEVSGEPTPWWDVPAGIEVAVAGADGLHLLTGADDRVIDPGVFDKVVADPTGDGWFVQEGSAKIHHVGDDGRDDIVIGAETGTLLQLHDVGLVDDAVTVFYNVNLVRRGFGDPAALDQLRAFDLSSGASRKIADVGGWETSIDVTYGGGKLVGIWTSEAQVEPWSVDLDGHLDVVDMSLAGLAPGYSDDPQAPRSLAISAEGSRLSWVSWNVTADGRYVSHRLVSVDTDGSNRRELTLPAGPAGIGGILDRGDYVVADSYHYVDGSPTPAALIDATTGGMLVLPIEGATAAAGHWAESPQWPIASPVAVDITEQIRALEPQWASGLPDVSYEDALTQLLLADGSEGECTSRARLFPNYTPGDGPFYIELRQFCDDSVAGAWYEVFILGPMPDGSITGGAYRRDLCRRGVTPEGLCV